jgi:hypothetical protein
LLLLLIHDGSAMEKGLERNKCEEEGGFEGGLHGQLDGQEGNGNWPIPRALPSSRALHSPQLPLLYAFWAPKTHRQDKSEATNGDRLNWKGKFAEYWGGVRRRAF